MRPISTSGWLLMKMTGVRSFSVSKVRLLYSVTLAEICRLCSSSVWPSGVARATRDVAIVVPPPVTFSTITFCPNLSARTGAMVRASWSVGPPAG